MSQLRLTTYQDAIQHVVDYLGAASGDDNVRFARAAVQDAYNEFPAVHQWSYLFTRGRINTVAPYTTGTITYTDTTRTVTLASGTWPSWVLQGVLIINNIPYAIASNPSSTTITLTPQSNPGADVAAGTSYTLYQDSYSCPIDFASTDEVANISNGLDLEFEHPSTWLTFQRVYRGPATPRHYTIIGSTAYFGLMSMRLYPPPDAIYPLDFMYKRRPRALSVAEYTAGTVATTSGSTTINGSGTSWNSDMVGSVIRFSAAGNTDTPTGPSGENPFSYERTVLAVSAVDTITVDADPGITTTGIHYAISDPMDIEEGAMLSFFWRYVEKKIRSGRRMTPAEGEMESYAESLERALEADNRSTSRQAAGGAGRFGRRLRDFPSGADGGA